MSPTIEPNKRAALFLTLLATGFLVATALEVMQAKESRSAVMVLMVSLGIGVLRPSSHPTSGNHGSPWAFLACSFLSLPIWPLSRGDQRTFTRITAGAHE